MTRQNRKRDYWPTRGWRTSTPEEQGIDSQGLNQAFDFIVNADHGPAQRQSLITKLDLSKINIHSIAIIRHGYLVADAYFHPYPQDTKHDLASVTKSITSTVVAIALNKGYIKSVKQPVLDFFPSRTVANIDARKKTLTLEHLLTMSSGLDCHAKLGEITLRQMWQQPDWVQFALDLSMIEEPGTRFEYCSPGSHLLSAIVKETTGMNTLDFAKKYLFKQLGISDLSWPASNHEVNNGWGRLRMKPHDMAKIGYLYLNNGSWDGEQILPPDWVDAASSKHSSLPPVLTPWDGYGYQWWLCSLGFYSARGRGSQLITVVPDKDMVVVITGGHNRVDVLTKALNSFIIPAVKSESSLPRNTKSANALAAGIKEIARGKDNKQSPPLLPSVAKKISGEIFKIDAKPRENTPYPAMWASFSLSFDKADEATLSLKPIQPEGLYWIGLDQNLPVGLDGTFRITPQGSFDIPVALKGSWETENTFILYFDELGNINNWKITMTFEDTSNVVVLMQESTFCGDATFDGRLSKD